jgi:hypothetical protein
VKTEGSFSIEVPLNGAGPRVKTAPIFAKKEKAKAKKKALGEVSGTRRELDAYDTPSEVALACVEWCHENLKVPEAPLVLDPTAGGGPFAAAARSIWPASRVVAVDIRDVCRATCEAAGAIFACADALTLAPATIKRADLIVTNPPFKLADELVRHLWVNMKEGASLAFLLSVTFLGSDDRWEVSGDGSPIGLLKVAPLTYCVPIVPRPSFIGSTGPKFEAALMVWKKLEMDEHQERFGVFRGAIIPDEPIRWVKVKKKRGEK